MRAVNGITHSETNESTTDCRLHGNRSVMISRTELIEKNEGIASMPNVNIKTPYARLFGVLYDLYMKNTYRPISIQLNNRLMIFKAILHWLLFTNTPDETRKPS